MILPISVYSSNFSGKSVQRQFNFAASSSSQKEEANKKHKRNVILGVISLLGVCALSDILIDKWVDYKSNKDFEKNMAEINRDIEKTNAEWKKMEKETKDILKDIKLETENVIKRRL